MGKLPINIHKQQRGAVLIMTAMFFLFLAAMELTLLLAIQNAAIKRNIAPANPNGTEARMAAEVGIFEVLDQWTQDRFSNPDMMVHPAFPGSLVTYQVEYWGQVGPAGEALPDNQRYLIVRGEHPNAEPVRVGALLEDKLLNRNQQIIGGGLYVDPGLMFDPRIMDWEMSVWMGDGAPFFKAEAFMGSMMGIAETDGMLNLSSTVVAPAGEPSEYVLACGYSGRFEGSINGTATLTTTNGMDTVFAMAGPATDMYGLGGYINGGDLFFNIFVNPGAIINGGTIMLDLDGMFPPMGQVICDDGWQMCDQVAVGVFLGTCDMSGPNLVQVMWTRRL